MGMTSGQTRSEGEPQDRLTRLCDDMTQAGEASPHYREGDRWVIFITNDSERRGGLVLAGYDDDGDAMAHIFTHLEAVFAANGSKLVIAPLARDRLPGGRSGLGVHRQPPRPPTRLFSAGCCGR